MANTVQATAVASCDHDRGALILARVRQRVSSNIAARSVHGEVDPTSDGCVMKSGSKVWLRNNATHPFRMVYPEREGRVVTSPHFSPMKRVKTATWSRSVNSEDFLIAEADHVQIQPSTRRDLPRDAPSRSKRQPRQHLLSELATITDVSVLQMAHCADHQRTQAKQARMAFGELVRENVKRFDTIFTEIRPCSSSMNSRMSSKSSGVKRRGLPPT